MYLYRCPSCKSVSVGRSVAIRMAILSFVHRFVDPGMVIISNPRRFSPLMAESSFKRKIIGAAARALKASKCCHYLEVDIHSLLISSCAISPRYSATRSRHQRQRPASGEQRFPCYIERQRYPIQDASCTSRYDCAFKDAFVCGD